VISYKKFSGYEASQYRSNFLRLSNFDLFQEIITTHAWSPIIWKNDYARTDNFEFSDFLVLDFDEPGSETLDDINNSLSDHKRIIATTRSHQIEKNGIVCDRFRLIVPWDKRITDYKIYRANYEKVLSKYDWADKSCLDGARFFFPSKKVIYLDRDAEYKWEITETIPILPVEKVEKKIPREIPSWCLNFINNGAIYNGSRNLKVFAVALELFERDFNEAEIRRLLLRAPINWVGVNVEAALKSAKTKAGK